MDKISNALSLAFSCLIDEVVEGFRVYDVFEEQDKKYIDLIPFNVKVRKAENVKGPFTFIGVAVIQKKGTALTASLSKLVDFNNLKQTRACMVRSENITGTTAQNHALTLLNNGGEWVAMIIDQIVPILALQALAEKLEQYDLTSEQVIEYVDSEKLLTENALIKEILSKPEGKPPKNTKPSDINKLASIPQSLSVQDNGGDSDLQADDSLLNE